MNMMDILEQYKTTDRYKSLSKNTKTLYGYVCKKRDIYKYSHEYHRVIIADNYSESTYNVTLSILNTLCEYGVEQGFIIENPYAKYKPFKTPKRTVRWTREQVSMFYRSAVSCYNTQELVDVFMLCYYLGQRPCDILNLKSENYNNIDCVTIKQQKTGTILRISIPNEVKFYFIRYTNRDNKLSHREINRQFANIRKLANLPEELQLRDLRKTAILEVIENGGTLQQARSISGHKSEKVLQEVYVPLTVKMSQDAQNIRFEVKIPLDKG